MVRKIIKIDEDKCNGCGICVEACDEGALQMVDGKARLVKDDYCDGLGDCLPTCPTGAISMEERKAAPFNIEAAMAAKENKVKVNLDSELSQWPIQVKLMPSSAPYLDGAHLLIAADCTAYAYGNFHQDFIKGKVTLIACPKLDMVDYTDKFAEILSFNDIKSVTLVRMQVPCCGGLSKALVNAFKKSGKIIPWQIITISTKGEIIE